MCIRAWRSHDHSFYIHLETTKSCETIIAEKVDIDYPSLAEFVSNTEANHNTTSLQTSLITIQELRLTVICDDLLSILFLCGFVVHQDEVLVVAVGTAHVVHQVGSAFEASVALRGTTTKVKLIPIM